MKNNHRHFFAITPLIPHLIFVGMVLGIYYYIVSNDSYPDWNNTFFIVTKIIIAFEVLVTAARSFWSPILALIASIVLLFSIQVYDVNLVAASDAWQLMGISLIGFLVTIFIKL
jgi:hypothetical protein